MSDFGKVTCPYCEEEKINKEKYFEANPQMIKFKVYNCECECCYDSKKVDWIDAVIKPYTTYVGGYSGY